MREIPFARRNLARLLDPVFAERTLQPIDCRADDAKTGVAPMVLVLCMSGPLSGEPEAAEVSDAAIDDHDLAVVAIVQAAEVAEADGMEHAHLRARIAHQLLKPLLHLVAAGGIQQQSHFHAFTRFRRERVGYFIADRSFPPDVRLDVNTLARFADVPEQR